MASVRVDTRLFCPFAAIAFIVVSFHWTTSLAAAWDRPTTALRQKMRLAIGVARPKPIGRKYFNIGAILLWSAGAPCYPLSFFQLRGRLISPPCRLGPTAFADPMPSGCTPEGLASMHTWPMVEVAGGSGRGTLPDSGRAACRSDA